MKTLSLILSILILNLFVFSSNGINKTRYEKRKEDKVLKEIREHRKKVQSQRDSITNKIIEKHRKENKNKRKERKSLKSDIKGVHFPKTLKVFKTVWHNKPVPQYYTGTCWSFSATSFFESEIYRISNGKKQIKLSEMYTVYYEYVEKARGFIKERGYSYVSEGSESNAVIRIWKKYGMVPYSVYNGLVDYDKYDHTPLIKELNSYLNYIKSNNLWNEEENLKHVRLILNKYMGEPPTKFKYNGKTYTPKEFLKYTGLNLNDYYGFMSTKSAPFYEKSEFKVPDNWWHSKDYYNVPLNVFYFIIKRAIKSGYSMVIGGDVSEPGKLGEYDVAFIPDFDIPSKYINQDSREFRIYNGTTGDDHGIHLVGYVRYKGHDWFLIKDSGRSARYGKHKGYYFFRDDFIKLKMLTFMVHKDMVKDILKKFN